MANLKEKFSKFCDEYEKKLEEAKQKRQERKEKRKQWLEEHPNLERLASTTMIVGSIVTVYGGLIALTIAAAKDEREHPERYVRKEDEEEVKTDFDILIDAAEAIGLQKGEGCQIVVDKDGNTAIKRKYIIPYDDDEDNIPEEETKETSIDIMSF